MSVIKSNKKSSNCVILILCFFVLMLNYRLVTAEYFAYLSFSYEYFSYEKLFISVFYTMFIILLYKAIKNDFYKIVYSIYLTLIYFGQAIYYIYNNSSFILVFYLSIPAIILYLVDRFSTSRISVTDIKLKITDKFTWLVLIFVALFMIAPFFKNYNLVNFKNLLFIDVYDTRTAYSEKVGGILGYLFSPISRVVIPFLFIYSLENKKRFLMIVSIVSIIMMYLLNGALKSIFFGFLACVLFYKGTYYFKEKRFLLAMLLGTIMSLIEPLVNGTAIITDYMRRIFFVPAYLFQVYFDYFESQPTYFLHSRIAKILGYSLKNHSISGTIPHFIGEEIIGKTGLSANVGIFVEGFISFGTVGVIIASIIFGLIIKYLNKRSLSPAYFGMVFTYIYVINTSFIETLFITHGLLFYLIFALIIIPNYTSEENTLCDNI